MRNNEMRYNLPNENHSHLHFKSKLNNEICDINMKNINDLIGPKKFVVWFSKKFGRW